MNGLGREVQAQVISESTPVAYMQPIAITPASIKWVIGGVIAAIWSLYTADFLYRPAKQTDFEALSKVVLMLQTAQENTNRQLIENRDATARLTLAVDNLSGIVSRIGAPAVRAPKPLTR